MIDFLDIVEWWNRITVEYGIVSYLSKPRAVIGIYRFFINATTSPSKIEIEKPRNEQCSPTSAPRCVSPPRPRPLCFYPKCQIKHSQSSKNNLTQRHHIQHHIRAPKRRIKARLRQHRHRPRNIAYPQLRRDPQLTRQLPIRNTAHSRRCPPATFSAGVRNSA